MLIHARSLMIVSLAASVLGAAGNGGSPAEVEALRFIDRHVLPYTTGFAGTVFEDTLFAGISGLDFDAATGSYYALSDDRSQNAPPGGDPSARFYTLSIAFDEDGFVGDEPVTIESVTALLRPDGTTFPALGVDPESIRVREGRGVDSLLWTSEGAASATSSPPLQDPFVREMELDGSFLGELRTPAKFKPDGVGPAQTKGVRNNLGFESMTLSVDGTKLYAATESALFQDGRIATFLNTALSRIIEFDTRTGQAIRELVYVVDAVPIDPQGAFADNGLVEMLAIGDGVFLVVERSFITGYGNHIRIYRIDMDDATDVSTLESLQEAKFNPVSKTLLFTVTPKSGFSPDNIEGITSGPDLPDGTPTFILVSDNNFSLTQVTHFLLLAATSAADLNGDGDVDEFDLALLLGAWGACPTKGSCAADLDGNGVVNGFDLAVLLGAWR